MCKLFFCWCVLIFPTPLHLCHCEQSFLRKETDARQQQASFAPHALEAMRGQGARQRKRDHTHSRNPHTLVVAAAGRNGVVVAPGAWLKSALADAHTHRQIQAQGGETCVSEPLHRLLKTGDCCVRAAKDDFLMCKPSQPTKLTLRTVQAARWDREVYLGKAHTPWN